jgi:hypothetical protein
MTPNRLGWPLGRAKTVANNVSNILARLQLAERGQALVAGATPGLGRRPDGAPERS